MVNNDLSFMEYPRESTATEAPFVDRMDQTPTTETKVDQHGRSWVQNDYVRHLLDVETCSDWASACE